MFSYFCPVLRQAFLKAWMRIASKLVRAHKLTTEINIFFKLSTKTLIMKQLLLTISALLFATAVCAEGYQVNTLSAKQLGMGHVGTGMKLNSESIYFNPAGTAFQTSRFSFSVGITGINPMQRTCRTTTTGAIRRSKPTRTTRFRRRSTPISTTKPPKIWPSAWDFIPLTARL